MIAPVPQKTPSECCSAEVLHNGKLFSLVLTRQYYSREGSCSLEVVSSTRSKNGEPVCSHFLDAGGCWHVTGGGDVSIDGMGLEATPSVLSVDITTPEDLDDASPIINALLEQLKDWAGADAVREWS